MIKWTHSKEGNRSPPKIYLLKCFFPSKQLLVVSFNFHISIFKSFN